MIEFKKLFSFSQKEIDLAFKKASLVGKSNGLKLLKSPCDLEYGKILIITPKKCGKANLRNQLRRRIKAIFYEEKLFQKPAIYILLAYKKSTEFSFDQLKEFLTKNIEL